MPASQDHITTATRMGANLVADGTTFRVWAPAARAVYVNGHFGGVDRFSEVLTNDGNGFWAGFIPGVKEGDRYKFYVVGRGHSGFKRDPYARELTTRRISRAQRSSRPATVWFATRASISGAAKTFARRLSTT